VQIFDIRNERKIKFQRHLLVTINNDIARIHSLSTIRSSLVIKG